MSRVAIRRATSTERAPAIPAPTESRMWRLAFSTMSVGMDSKVVSTTNFARTSLLSVMVHFRGVVWTDHYRTEARRFAEGAAPLPVRAQPSFGFPQPTFLPAFSRDPAVFSAFSRVALHFFDVFSCQNREKRIFSDGISSIDVKTFPLQYGDKGHKPCAPCAPTPFPSFL